MPGIARHTPQLSGDLVSRVLLIDGALLSHVGDVLATLTAEYNWVEIGDTVSAVVDSAQETLDSYYGGHMVGAISYFLGQLSPGWIPCDGSTLAQADYPELASVLDAIYLDDVADTILLPDLRDIFIVGAGSLYSLAATGGLAEVALSVAEMPTHSHDYIPPLPNLDIKSAGAPDLTAATPGTATPTTSSGSGDAHENRPPYHALIPAIFTGR